MKILLDSFAVFVWLREERGWKKVRDLIIMAENRNVKLFMSQMNLAEVYYINLRNLGEEKAKNIIDVFLLLPIEIVHPSDDIIWKAAEIKAEIPIAFMDCFAISTALFYDAKIVTGDREFNKVSNLVEIEWL